ncbi:glycoside hydrolase family protein [Autumnicola psychrophila]|uniref:Glycoside hydrolase family protein n=1 Tax=Autumnicola psychrophila TaxID=3075592 RepID=A0ABU3DQG8_9FLAO|nr:glycoside hydrolase family protein [Zunongwangia sp. F225]MDT0685332.1 glycoside hydrolase family protein [Zunongwangia sp. F225]
MNNKIFVFCFLALYNFTVNTNAQIIEREIPKEWNGLVEGGRFMDLFLPIPIQSPLSKDAWGAENVIPRDVNNGIEDSEWSYWGGNIKVSEDGKYHLFVARWKEDSPKGHGEWPQSHVVQSVSENSIGPYKVKNEIGPGHNPEIFRLSDGRYVIYVIDGYYMSQNINGPWDKHSFDFDSRDRPVIEGLSNLTFAQREDGSYLMICRGGGVWFSKTGISPYYQVSQGSVYPPVDGRFEDPVVWRDHIQYHMIVNDWYGRIAYYLRSKDGINWKVDPGMAYKTGIAVYEDGTQVDWFKYERIKILQDKLGRAIQANFAVIDVLKNEDKGNDNHSSKNISIPLLPSRHIQILNKKDINSETQKIKIKILAEEGFDPHQDINFNSLRFGASEEVDFGRGSKLIEIQEIGADVILTFEGTGNGLTQENFVAKLLGRTNEGKILFGYARLPGIDYLEPALSAQKPVFTKVKGGYDVSVEVENFGQVASKQAEIKIEFIRKNISIEIAKGTVPPLNSFEKSNEIFHIDKEIETGVEYTVKVTTLQNDRELVIFRQEIFLN